MASGGEDVPSSESHINAGLDAQRRGDWAGAAEAFALAVEHKPQDAEALHFLGVALTQCGKFAEAVDAFGKAMAAGSAISQTRVLRGLALERLNRLEEAAADLLDGVRRAPNDVFALTSIGRVAFRLERDADAEAALVRASRLAPDDVAVLALLSRVQLARQKWEAAAETALRHTALKPDSAEGWRNLANAKLELSRYREAKDAFDRVIDLEGPSPGNDLIYGKLCNATGDFERAETHLQRSLAGGGDRAETLSALSTLRLYQGDVAAAKDLALQALSADPDSFFGHTALAEATEGRIDDASLASMERLSRDEATPPHKRAQLLFGVGAAYDARGDIDVAFATFSEANDLNARTAAQWNRDYARGDDDQFIERSRRFYPRPRPEAYAAEESAPIFIVGMPRSGTSLLEAALGSHRAVRAAGELSALPTVAIDADLWADRARAETIFEAPLEVLQNWRRQYFSMVPDLHGASRFIDKHPGNYMNVGLARTLFPEAKIIFLTRNPVETCFSIWRRNFQPGWRFTNRFEDAAWRYRSCLRLMNHWRAAGFDFLPLRYEALKEDFESMTRRVVDYCGLEWDADILRFHESGGVTATFSAAQVRKPVEEYSSGGADRYGALLDPLRAALTSAGVDPDTGALLTTD
jgi:tetratricopeptide (TPR) repeat protein